MGMFVEMIAARFCSDELNGSYSRDTTKRYMKNVSTEIALLASNIPPTSATVPMPSFNIIPARTTNSALPSSEAIMRFSCRSIFLSKPFRYFSSALLDFKSRMVSSAS